MEWKIPLFKMDSNQNDVDAVSKVIRRATFWVAGPEITKFEEKIASYMGRKHALTFNSGTSALHVLLEAYGVKNYEVIVPSFTFISTASSVLLAGGIPVFAESEEKTGGLSTKSVEEKITSKTKAVIALHYAGYVSSEIESLRILCKEKNILLIEDNAESMGASLNGTKAGCFGDSAILSFCQNKIISTGEGGAILTDSREIYEKTKLLRSHGREEHEEDYFSTIEDNEYITPGYNFRMSSISAALGISQLSRINTLIELRRKKAQYLIDNLCDIPEISFFEQSSRSSAVFQMFVLKLPTKKIRDLLQKHLENDAIMSKVYFPPAHLKKIYADKFGYKKGDLPRTEELCERVLTPPFFPTMTKEEMNVIIGSIKKFFKR